MPVLRNNFRFNVVIFTEFNFTKLPIHRVVLEVFKVIARLIARFKYKFWAHLEIKPMPALSYKPQLKSSVCVHVRPKIGTVCVVMTSVLLNMVVMLFFFSFVHQSHFIVASKKLIYYTWIKRQYLFNSNLFRFHTVETVTSISSLD